jgi:hypothetical protein
MLSHLHFPGAPATHSSARHSCQAVSPALVEAIAPTQLQPSKCYLVGVGPGTLDLCTVSTLLKGISAGTNICLNAELIRIVHKCIDYTPTPHNPVLPLQVKAVRLIRSAQALVYDDLGTQVTRGRGEECSCS